MKKHEVEISLNELYLKDESKSTLKLFNSILNKDIGGMKDSIQQGANLSAIRPLDEFSTLVTSPLGYLFEYGKSDNKDLNKKAGFMTRALTLLLKENINFMTDPALNILDKETYLYSLLVKEGFEKIEKNISLLKNDTTAFWITELLLEKKEKLLVDFLEKYPFQDNGYAWGFKLNDSEESLLSLSIQTRNMNIINSFLKDILPNSINKDPAKIIGFTDDYEDFTLLTEVLNNFNNDSDSKKDYYYEVVKNLIEKGAELPNKEYSSKINKLILEVNLDINKNKLEQTMKVK